MTATKRQKKVQTSVDRNDLIYTLCCCKIWFLEESTTGFGSCTLRTRIPHILCCRRINHISFIFHRTASIGADPVHENELRMEIWMGACEFNSRWNRNSRRTILIAIFKVWNSRPTISFRVKNVRGWQERGCRQTWSVTDRHQIR